MAGVEPALLPDPFSGAATGRSHSRPDTSFVRTRARNARRRPRGGATRTVGLGVSALARPAAAEPVNDDSYSPRGESLKAISQATPSGRSLESWMGGRERFEQI